MIFEDSRNNIYFFIYGAITSLLLWALLSYIKKFIIRLFTLTKIRFYSFKIKRNRKRLHGKKKNDLNNELINKLLINNSWLKFISGDPRGFQEWEELTGKRLSTRYFIRLILESKDVREQILIKTFRDRYLQEPITSSLTDKSMNRLKNSFVLAPLIIIGSVVIAVSVFFGALSTIGESIIKIVSFVTPENQSYSDGDFFTEVDSRLGITYKCPKGWHLLDGNVDGSYSIVYPEQKNVSFSIWSRDVEKKITIEEILDSWKKINSNITILEVNESGRRVLRWHEESSGPPATIAHKDGRRILYEYQDGSKYFRVIELITMRNNKEIHMSAKAPAELFDSYQHFFLEVINSLSILDKNRP